MRSGCHAPPPFSKNCPNETHKKKLFHIKEVTKRGVISHVHPPPPAEKGQLCQQNPPPAGCRIILVSNRPPMTKKAGLSLTIAIIIVIITLGESER